jgi:hypothetical protein
VFKAHRERAEHAEAGTEQLREREEELTKAAEAGAKQISLLGV